MIYSSSYPDLIDLSFYSSAFCYFELSKHFHLVSSLFLNLQWFCIPSDETLNLRQAFEALHQSTSNSPFTDILCNSWQANLLSLYQVSLPFALTHVDPPAGNNLPLWEANLDPSLNA